CYPQTHFHATPLDLPNPASYAVPRSRYPVVRKGSELFGEETLEGEEGEEGEGKKVEVEKEVVKEGDGWTSCTKVVGKYLAEVIVR
ncbi:hypothetical protein HK102_009154, partial [Quaeritorhiza haematococci]